MADKTHIEWTDATWNPLVGCTKVSPGCDNCYAEGVVNRFAGTSPAFPARFDVVTMRGASTLAQPLHWARPRRIFVNSLSDLFHADVPDGFIAQVFAVMAVARHHTFQLLTKRHARMRSLLRSEAFRELVDGHMIGEAGGYSHLETQDVGWPLPNVWLGVSVEDQHWADLRIPVLLDIPAAAHWISAEPLLGPLSLHRYLRGPIFGEGCMWSRHGAALDWVVAGGESGADARPMHPDWPRILRAQCAATNTPFLFKQWGSWRGPAPDDDFTTGKGHAQRLPAFLVSKADGTVHCYRRPDHPDDEVMVRVGKKAAGRLLDGVLHDGYPS